MNEEKLKQFVNDKVMKDAVYTYLLNEFLSDNVVKEVNVLAASRLAVDFLKQGFKRMERVINKKPEPESIKQVGL